MRVPMLVALAALLVAALSGCSEASQHADPVPESFTAVYQYHVNWGKRDGFLDVTLDGPVSTLSHDGSERPAYRLKWEFPPIESADDSRHLEAALDGTFQQVRLRNCSKDGDDPCGLQTTQWPDQPIQSLFSYGLPLRIPRGDPQRTDHSDGSITIGELHFAAGRLVPDVVQFGTEPGHDPEWLKLTEYHSGQPLASIDAWPAIPAPLANATAAFAMFPGEDVDLFQAGWTPLDALDAVAQDPDAAAILADGGCVVKFEVTHMPDGSPSAAVAPRNAAYANLVLQDKAGHTTRWSTSRNAGLASLAGLGQWSAPERDDGWPFPSQRSCAEQATGPAPRVSADQALDVARRWFPVDGSRDLVFRVEKQPGLHENGAWTPLNIGLEYQLTVFPEFDASPFAGEQHGFGHGLSIDGWTGTFVQMFSGEGDSPP